MVLVQWIREKLFNTFRSFVRDLVRGGGGGGGVDGGSDMGMQPPTVLLRMVQNYCIALQRATQHSKRGEEEKRAGRKR